MTKEWKGETVYMPEAFGIKSGKSPNLGRIKARVENLPCDMQLVITPTYSDIFEDKPPEIEELLANIPSEVCLSVLAVVNAQLYYGRGLETQLRIIDFLTFRQSPTTRQAILNKIIKRTQGEPSIEFFTLLYSTEFMHYELTHFRDFNIPDTNADQELNFIKAYLLIAENLNEKYHASYLLHESMDGDYFQKTSWPTLIDQFEVNHNINPITGMVKGIALLNYLEFHTPYTSYVKNFLKHNRREKGWNYILDLIGVVKLSWDIKREKPDKLYPFHLNSNAGFESLFEAFAVSPTEYTKRFKDGKQNFSGLKDKPLYRSSKKDTYVVLNWNFLCNKLYDGLIFDFYKHSGIAEGVFANLLDFKKFVSKEIIEKFLFKKLIEHAFKRKHIVSIFDDETAQGLPDAYVRDGKRIYLFEIKDAFFPVRSVNSLSYTKIKETIDQKFNNESKGTGQIVKQIQKLATASFEHKTFEELKLKRKNLRIYPVMIYTDNFFNLPGINQYLKEAFKSRIKQTGLDASFGKIQDLTFINLSFFIDNIHFLSDSRCALHDLIDSFHSSVKISEARLQRTRSLANLFPPNDPFEEVIAKKFKDQLRQSRDFVDTIVEVLNLTEDLE